MTECAANGRTGSGRPDFPAEGMTGALSKKRTIMKKIGIYLFFTLCVYGYSSAQNGERYPASSGFETCPTDSTALNNLNVLCRVWGFVKYHHPVFADTTADADSELLRLLPQVASAQQKDRNRVLAEWVSSLGRFRTVRKAYERTIDSVEWECTTDLKWIHDRRTLGGKLSRILCNLRYAERDENRYCPRMENLRIAFPGEKALTGSISHDYGWKDWMNHMCWTNKDTIRVVYRRDLAVRDTVIAVNTTNREISEKRYEVDLPDTMSYRLLGDSIGYIYAGTFRPEHKTA